MAENSRRALSLNANPFPAWPVFEEDEVNTVSDVLRSGEVNYWTGEQGRQFEIEFAEFCSVRYAVAVANGSVGLEAALIGLGIGPGDEVIVTPRSFVASANAVVLRGATPVFADVDIESQNLSVQTIERAISPKTRAILIVHLAGWPATMDEICALARRKSIRVVEDCAQAHGARLNAQAVGSFGDVGVFSFCQDKIMTTGGEGGMVVTQDREIWERVWAYKDHGRPPNLEIRDDGSSTFAWIRESFGTNWRLTEMQSALGRIQLKKLPEWKRRRQINAGILNDQFASLDSIRTTVPGDNEDHAYYKYYAFVELQRLRNGWSRDRIVNEVNSRGVPCYSGSCPEIYREKAYERAGLVPADHLPVARVLGETSLMLPVHPTLKPEHMHRIAAEVAEVIREATRT